MHNSNYLAFQDIEKRTRDNNDVFRDEITVCNTGRTRYVMPTGSQFSDKHTLSDEFSSAVCSLPVNYSPSVYRQFLDDWGTVCIFYKYI